MRDFAKLPDEETIYVAEMWSNKHRDWVPLNAVRFSPDRFDVEQWLADYQTRRKSPSRSRIRPYRAVHA